MKKCLKRVALMASISYYILLGSSAFADDASGIFLGINAGVALYEYSGINHVFIMEDKVLEYGIRSSMVFGWLAGVNFGYRQFLTDKSGLNYYLEYDYMGQIINTNERVNGPSSERNMLTANVDFFHNFNNYFGMYLGSGLGYATQGFALPLNAGFQFNIDDSNTITLGGKLTFVNFSSSVMVGYRYNFGW